MTRKIVIFVVIFIIGLLGYTSWNTRQARAFWRDTSIPCLSGGHTNATQHIHQSLVITVDGAPETIPANIGIDSLCMAEVHTHDTDGKIHVETAATNTVYTLADFFAIWGKPVVRDGYDNRITVNGKSVATPVEVILHDHDVIGIDYTTQK